jgi:hypothetical protein
VGKIEKYGQMWSGVGDDSRNREKSKNDQTNMNKITQDKNTGRFEFLNYWKRKTKKTGLKKKKRD